MRKLTTMMALLAWGVVGWAQEATEQETRPAPTLAPTLGLPFQDHAVLQQLIPLPVWGETLPGAAVTVTFGGQAKSTVADAAGAWRVVLDPMTATPLATVNSTPAGQALRVRCELGGEQAETVLRDLVLGEVWLCAGQSNMAGRMRRSRGRHFPPDSLEQADYPGLRQLDAGKAQAWTISTPTDAADFKKVAFFFGRRVYTEVRVPVGLIVTAVGGSKIESWLNQAPDATGKNYDRLVAPVVGYGVRGMLWYQGESNERDRRDYQPKLAALIGGWRSAWQQTASAEAAGPRADFSVYFVQLPGIGESNREDPAGGDGRAEIRQAYVETLALPHTGMAVTIDIGDRREHPPNKYDTGVRLARLALHHDYGQRELVPSGPIYRDHVVEGGAIRVRFDHAGDGLMLAEKTGFQPPEPRPDATLGWLAIQGRDGAWHWAEGRIDGADLIVSSARVTDPVAVRYAYTQHPTGPLLYNSAGLPASPFSTIGYGPAPNP